MIESFTKYFLEGAKPKSEWLCGLECELFGYDAMRFERLNHNQIADVLKAFSSDLHFEGDVITEAKLNDGARLTLEPGGQIELSNAPRKTLKEIENDYEKYLSRLGDIAEERNFVFLAIGFDPLRKLEEQNWYPKPRYDVMRPYLLSRGKRAWDMMTRTSGIQVNLDYESEDDLKKKFIVGNALAPIVSAMFANSPFMEGKLSGYKSTRLAVWLQTDDDRSGISPIFFNDDFTIEDFVSYTLDVPMIFTRRNGDYSGKFAGVPFRDYLPQSSFEDWTDHLTTIFTEARLKQYIELRSMDCCNARMMMAAQALWKGLFYDNETLDEALRIAPRLSETEMRTLQEKVAREGLNAKHLQVDVLNLAKEVIRLASTGLKQTAPDEEKYLDILKQQVIEDEVCPADILLREWNGSIERVIERCAITKL